MSAPADPDVPEAVTYREIQEILRTFRDSGWTGMTVDLHGMRITVGKDGPPRGPAGASTASVAPPAAQAGGYTAGSAGAGDLVGDRQTSPDHGGYPHRTGPDGRSSVAGGTPAAAPVALGPSDPSNDRQSGPDEGRIPPRTGPDRRSSTGEAAPVVSTAGAAVPTGTAGPAAAVPDGPSDGLDLSGCVDVTSPAVGAFWIAPSPGQPPFVQIGQTVAQDDQLAIVEVMKLMNPVVSTVAGTVVQVCAANADLVEYEQVLFRIRPSDG